MSTLTAQAEDIAKAFREGGESERVRVAQQYGICLLCVYTWCPVCKAGHCYDHCPSQERVRWLHEEDT